MAKEESLWDTILKIGAFIGGAWIFFSLLRASSPYTCPRCDARVLYSEKKCYSCNLDLEWRHIK